MNRRENWLRVGGLCGIIGTKSFDGWCSIMVILEEKFTGNDCMGS